MTIYADHRLDGLEPDNLLAFMALLGLLRTLEEARPDWHPRVSWTVDEPPLRPCLHVAEKVAGNVIVEAAAERLAALAPRHDFEGLPDLTLLPDDAKRKLRQAADLDPYTAELWAALISDAAIARDGKKVEPTPLCLMFGQGHQHFLSRLASVPRQATHRRREAPAATNTKFPRRNACVRRCSHPGNAPTQRIHSDGTPMKTCVMRCAREIRPTQKPRKPRSTAPTGSPQWASPC